MKLLSVFSRYETWDEIINFYSSSLNYSVLWWQHQYNMLKINKRIKNKDDKVFVFVFVYGGVMKKISSK